MINVFPQPYFFEEKEGEFVFREKVYFALDKNFENKEFVEFCSKLWNNFTANKSELEVVLVEGFDGNARISLSKDCVKKFETEYEYEFECTQNGIDIAYSEPIGLIHAFATILQLISAYRRKTEDFIIKNIHIQDKPALKMRGMHLCVFPETKLLFLKKLVGLCGLYKCTHIVLEFWGMYKFETLEPLSWEFAYTKEDLAPIFELGKAFGVEFIPMFNHMGHATQSRFKAGKSVLLDRAPEYEELFVPGGWTWDIKNPEALELLKNVREEMCRAFPSGEYFHMGCDETYALDNRWDGYDPEDNETFISYVNDVAEHLKSIGRTPIMWADMFIDKEKFKFPYVNNSSSRCFEYEKNIAKLDESVCLADWQYCIDETSEDTAKYFSEKREPSKVFMCPWDDTNKIRGVVRLAKKFGLGGIIGTTWNTVNHEIRHMVYTACVMWDTDDSKTDICTWETLKVFAAQNIRKLVPSKGVYADAGFLETELFHMVD